MSEETTKPVEEKPPGEIIVMHFADGQGDPDDDPDHVRSENETYYDDVIAPKLAEVAKLCGERKMSIVCDVEYEPGETGSTRLVQEGAGAKMFISFCASRCRGNIDAFIMNIYNRMEKRDELGVSIYMKLIENWKKNGVGSVV